MNTFKYLKSIVSRVVLPILVLAPVISSAQTFGNGQAPIDNNRNPVGALPTDTGILQDGTLIGTISFVIRWALGFIGIVIFLIFLYAGFEYATAGGDSAKAESAQKRMINAVIGLIIIFFAFVASNTILGFVFQAA
jgi:hypothetical protein